MDLLREKPFTFALVPRTTVSANGTLTSAAKKLPAPRNKMVFMLNIVSAPTAGTVDVYVESSIDGGLWVEVAHFDPIGVAEVARQLYFSVLAQDLTATTYDASAALGANGVRNLCLGTYRVKTVAASLTGTAVFDVLGVAT